MNFSYDIPLVALSIFVAVQASYVGLNLARLIPGAFALNRRLLIAGAALSLAVGIWGMHFIGMLAVVAPVAIDYAVLPTLISFLICVLVVGVAIYLAALRPLRSMVYAAVIMGLGIAAMHFIGMMAVHVSVRMTHDPVFVLASIAVAIAASGLALWLAFDAPRKLPFWLCAVVQGGAISGMHYTAMAGTTLAPKPGLALASGAISTNVLAVIVSLVAFSVSGVFMLTLIPVARQETPDETKWKEAGEPRHAAAVGPDLLASTAVETTVAAPVAVPVPGLLAPEETLPIERQGNRLHIGVGEIMSIHANAHYTYLFNGREDLFCPLSISEIFDRLPKGRFFRIHRSYIVNLSRIANIRKVGDAGVVELNSPLRRTAPISRGRLAALRHDLARFQTAGADSRLV